MGKRKRVSAVLGVAFGSLALCYLVSAWSLTLKNFGLSVEDQLVAQRILTPLLFVALAALAGSCEYFRRVRLQSGTKTGALVRMLCLVAVVVLPVVIVYFTMKTPFLNLFLWTLYLMVLVGYRRTKHYLVMLGVMLVVFGLYAKFVGIKTVYRVPQGQSSASRLSGGRVPRNCGTDGTIGTNTVGDGPLGSPGPNKGCMLVPFPRMAD